MSLTAPFWLLLVPALLLLGWRIPALRLSRPLRCLPLLLLVLALTQPYWLRRDDTLDLWILVDQSASTEGRIEQSLGGVRGILNRGRPNSRCQLHLIDFAAGAMPRVEGAAAAGLGSDETRLRTALQTAASLAEPDRANRVLILSDGQSTEPLVGAAARLKALEIPVDIRLLPRPSYDDWRITKFVAPPMVRPLEPAAIAVEVRGPSTGSATLSITRDGVTALEQEITLSDGVARLDFTDRLQAGGGHRYIARIVSPDDPRPGNNRREAVTAVDGGPRVVLATGYKDDYLAAAIRQQGFEISLVPPGSDPDPALLAGARALVLNNRRADTLSREFASAAARLVEEQGGGLLMLGGNQSFGSGGWFESPLDPVLPVSMELKEEHRKLQLALSIALDRSGSMSATVAGPAGGVVQKMQLAGEGAARAIELLGRFDLVSLHAVDTAAHVIAPLTKVEKNRVQLASLARRIESQGGGIYIYESLRAQWDAIKMAPVPNKHLILFADAADSEEPGEYKMLIDEIVASGANISVIGLGSNMDPDAELLRDIADRGGGRLFFTNRAVDLPAIFSQEVASVTRSLYLDAPVGVRATGQWPEISPTPLDWPAEVGAANITYLKKGAATAIITDDEYAAPLVSWHRRGLGRAAAAAFPFGGAHSEQVRAWQQSGDLVQSLLRWISGPDLPAGIALRSKLVGNSLRLTLAYDNAAAWQQRFATDPPQLVVRTDDRAPAPRHIPWRRLSPGRLEAEIPLPPGAQASGAVRIGDSVLPFGPVTAGDSPEWSEDLAARTALRSLVTSTGGRELANLSEAWLPPVSEVRHELDHLLLGAALALILIEALLSRTGRQMPQFPLPRFQSNRPRRRARATPPTAEPQTRSPDPPHHENDREDGDSQRRRSRYERAKRRGRK